jgi:hypothetical protein
MPVLEWRSTAWAGLFPSSCRQVGFCRTGLPNRNQAALHLTKPGSHLYSGTRLIVLRAPREWRAVTGSGDETGRLGDVSKRRKANGMRSVRCLAILALGVAQGQQYQPGQGVNFYSKDKEIALGQRLAQEVRQRTTRLDSAAVNDYVKRVGANLAAQFPGEWNFTFETVQQQQGGATDEPVALPGGPIFVSADLIVTAQSEAEFAGMLAHAMAHVVARHYTRQATKEDLGAIQTASLPVSAPGTAIRMGMLAFRRAMESEADYLAIKAMAAAGYDPARLGFLPGTGPACAWQERCDERTAAARSAPEGDPDRDPRPARGKLPCQR